MEQNGTTTNAPKNKFLTIGSFFFVIFLALATYHWWIGFSLLIKGMFNLGYIPPVCAPGTWGGSCGDWHGPFGPYFDLGWYLLSISIIIISAYVYFIKNMKIVGFLIMIFNIVLVSIFENLLRGYMAKPVIYLYPQEKKDISVKLNYQGELIAAYPAYDKTINGWEVTAYPDGHLISRADNQEYSYLFWEGKTRNQINWDITRGFIARGEDTREFLQKKLCELGLAPKEYNEFIVYWYPLMKDNKYNLIHFANEQYTATAPLTIIPKPDSMLRVFMVYKKLDKEVNIEPQELESFKREGFSVIEWGGIEIR